VTEGLPSNHKALSSTPVLPGKKSDKFFGYGFLLKNEQGKTFGNPAYVWQMEFMAMWQRASPGPRLMRQILYLAEMVGAKSSTWTGD
jgi:hypothetical protein